MPKSKAKIIPAQKRQSSAGAFSRAKKAPSPGRPPDRLASAAQKARSGAHSLTATELLQLQRSAGNRQVGRLLNRPAAPPIQRQLDANKYSPEAAQAAGLKAGFKLIGKTSFSNLVLALRAYFNSANKTEEYVNLNNVLRAANAYRQSPTRQKEHSGRKKKKEDDKSAWVNDLIGDAQREIDNLKAGVDTQLLWHFAGNEPEMAIMLAANNLAQVMGVSLEVLKGMAPEALKVEFTEKVYMEYSMKRKKGENTGAKGDLMKRLQQTFDPNLQKPIRDDRLPDGDAKTLYNLIVNSQIANAVALGSAKAPKFARGGMATEEHQPNVKGWSEQNVMKISGNDEFRDKVKGLIEVIKTVPVGQELLKKLGSAAEVGEDMVHGEAKTTVVDIAPPAVSSVARYDPEKGQYMYSASAGGASVVVDPDNEFVGADTSLGDREPWRIRNAAIGLFHELVHAYLEKIGGEDFASAEDPSQKMHVGSLGGIAELRVTGVPYEKEIEGRKYTFPFDNPEYNPISENMFRRQFAAAQGAEEVYLRPSYGTEPGQKPLSLDPTPI